MRVESFVRTLEKKVDEERNTYIQGPNHAVAPSFPSRQSFARKVTKERKKKRGREKKETRHIAFVNNSRLIIHIFFYGTTFDTSI